MSNHIEYILNLNEYFKNNYTIPSIHKNQEFIRIQNIFDVFFNVVLHLYIKIVEKKLFF